MPMPARTHKNIHVLRYVANGRRSRHPPHASMLRERLNTTARNHRGASRNGGTLHKLTTAYLAHTAPLLNSM